MTRGSQDLNTYLSPGNNGSVLEKSEFLVTAGRHKQLLCYHTISVGQKFGNSSAGEVLAHGISQGCRQILVGTVII